VSAGCGQSDAVSRHGGSAQYTAVTIQIGNVDVEAHTDGVDPTARFEHHRTVEVVAPEQPAAAAASVIGDLR